MGDLGKDPTTEFDDLLMHDNINTCGIYSLVVVALYTQLGIIN